MEKRIKNKISDYMKTYKESIKNKIMELDNHDRESLMGLVQFVYDYEGITIDENDFVKRKRTKNMVPLHERCIAMRANGEQCTRRKRTDCEFCGTHLKGSPNGTYDGENTPVSKDKIDIWSQDIRGILYYIDADGNVYDMNDIMRCDPSPKVILKYTKSEDGVYSLVR